MSNDHQQDHLRALAKKQDAEQARAWKERKKDRERYAREAEEQTWRDKREYEASQKKIEHTDQEKIEFANLCKKLSEREKPFSCKGFYEDTGAYKRERILEENKKLSEWKKNRSEKKVYEFSGS